MDSKDRHLDGRYWHVICGECAQVLSPDKTLFRVQADGLIRLCCYCSAPTDAGVGIIAAPNTAGLDCCR